MILYSVIPAEVVFKDFNWEERKDSIEIDYLGEKVTAFPLGSNSFKIDRLISTSPKSYLDSRLAPGNIIYYTPDSLQEGL
ncbi:MAG: hypothetical protein GX992_08420 [Clostridium sp.]|nr:hypothetical protein [Clostridium sp.]